MAIIIIAVLAIIFLLLWACIDIVPQAEARVIERLGVFRAVWNAGIHVKIPIIDRAVVPHVDLREQILELPKIGYVGSDSTFSENNSYDYRKRRKFCSGGLGAEVVAGASAEMTDNYASFNAGVRTDSGVNNRTSFYRSSKRFVGNNYSRIYEGSYSDYRDVITKDNVRMEIDAAVFYQVTDPKQYAYGMKQPLFALQKLTITNLRNIIGTLELDETLCSRELINSQLRASLDEATDSWGIKITRVEIESILPPDDIQEAMEKQAKAEREKRAKILIAEGQKQATILLAEAEKKKAILEAEAIEQAAILKAKGEAEALLEMKEAEAKSLAMLNENAPNDSVIRLKAIQGMEKVADGNATKVIIPSDLAGLVGLANGLVEGAR